MVRSGSSCSSSRLIGRRLPPKWLQVGHALLPRRHTGLQLSLSSDDALVDLVRQGHVALLFVVQHVEQVGNGRGVEAALHQLELLLLEGARRLHHLLRGATRTRGCVGVKKEYCTVSTKQEHEVNASNRSIAGSKSPLRHKEHNDMHKTQFCTRLVLGSYGAFSKFWFQVRVSHR